MISRCGGGGSGTFLGSVLSPVGGGLTLDSAVPAAGSLHVVFCSTSTGGDGGTGRFVSSATDANGHAYTVVTNSKPIIGLAEMDIGTGTNISSIMVGSVGRQCTAGDLGAGDAITVNWFNTGTGAFSVVYVVVWLPASFTLVTQRGGDPTYANGLGYPFASSFQSSLDWAFDDPTFPPNPDSDAFSLGAFAAFPGGGFTPRNGFVIASAGGAADLTVCGIDSLPALAIYEPGGDFAGAPSVTVGNYQTMPSMGGGGGGGRCARCLRCSKGTL